MSAKALIQELEHEGATTRRVLERVPGDRLGWKPHPKSMTIGGLAMHIAMTPAFITGWALQDSVEATARPRLSRHRRTRSLPLMMRA
jgi:hypothetical protein